MANAQQMLEWRGHTMVTASGDRIGEIEEIYLDNDTQKPEWALVGTGTSGSTFVPLAQADSDGDSVVVPYDQAKVTGAPQPEAGRELSRDDEAQLYSFYGLDYGEDRSDSGLPEGGRTGGREPVGRDVSGPETDDAMTRSEEQLRVGTQSRESGKARLRKHVVTENVTQTVPVSREEVRVTREPITDANRDPAMDGPELSSEEHEVTLHREVPTVDKRVVPQERVRMGTETVTGEQQVTDEVRKEQIEVDDPDAESRR